VSELDAVTVPLRVGVGVVDAAELKEVETVAVVLGLSVAEAEGAAELDDTPDAERVLLAVGVPVPLLLRDWVPEPVNAGDPDGVCVTVFVTVGVKVRDPVPDTVADDVPVDDVDGVEPGVSVCVPELVRVCEVVGVPVPLFVRVPLMVGVRVCVREPVTAALLVDVTTGVPVLDDDDVCVEVPVAAPDGV